MALLGRRDRELSQGDRRFAALAVPRRVLAVSRLMSRMVALASGVAEQQLVSVNPRTRPSQ
jgi:hypothetical protein